MDSIFKQPQKKTIRELTHTEEKLISGGSLWTEVGAGAVSGATSGAVLGVIGEGIGAVPAAMIGAIGGAFGGGTKYLIQRLDPDDV